MKSIVNSKVYRSIYLLIYILFILGIKIYLVFFLPNEVNFCKDKITLRFAMLFIGVFLPVIAITYFGAYRAINNYHKSLQNQYTNKSSARLLQRAEWFMVFRIIWMLVGFSAWNFSNIDFVFDLARLGGTCTSSIVSFDNFMVLNLITLQMIGLTFMMITLILIPIKLFCVK